MCFTISCHVHDKLNHVKIVCFHCPVNFTGYVRSSHRPRALRILPREAKQFKHDGVFPHDLVRRNSHEIPRTLEQSAEQTGTRGGELSQNLLCAAGYTVVTEGSQRRVSLEEMAQT